MLEQPARIGRYRIEGLLGRGAMGVVFKAHDPEIDRTVAIKLVRADLLEGDDRAHYVQRFRNEARMVGRCVHPNIVGIHDFSADEEHLFLVLEYVEGRHLGRRRAADGPLDLPLVGHRIGQVLDALEYAHAFGIVHRDIKPSNILLTVGDVVKVTDFGIARALASDVTMSSVLVGTPSYMSPEQCLGRSVDGRSDLFSLGCVLYEVLSGERAFGGANYVETTHRILHGEPKPIGELVPDLPPVVATLVDRALAKPLADRFESAAAMNEALRNALCRPDERNASPGDASPGDASEAPTIVATASAGRPAERRPPGEIASLGSRSIGTIERRLAAYLGPMARVHVRRAMAEADTPERFCALLGELLPPGREREIMLDDLRRIVAAGATASLAGRSGDGSPEERRPDERGLSDDVVQAHVRALAEIVGPIAAVMVRRALANAGSVEELTAACIRRIEDADGALRFQRSLARLAAR